MRRAGLGLMLLGLLLATGPAEGGPVRGGYHEWVQVEAGIPYLFEPVLFKGGERACVIVVGDLNPPMNITVKVFDHNKKLVARDERGGDFAAVIWYPPENGLYQVEIQTDGSVFNRCYVSWK